MIINDIKLLRICRFFNIQPILSTLLAKAFRPRKDFFPLNLNHDFNQKDFL